MGGFLTLAAYSPLQSLIAGMVFALGILALGRLSLVVTVGRSSGCFHAPEAFLTGAIVLFAITLIAGLTHQINVASAILVWLILLAGFLFEVLLVLRRIPPLVHSLRTRAPVPRLLLVASALMAFVIALHLFVAIAPTTRHDENAYHVLIPWRLLTENAIRVHPLPYEGSVMSQLGWQLSQVWLHMVRAPSAAAVASLIAALLAVGRCAALVHRYSGSWTMTILVALATLSSGLSITFMPTLGGHGLQYLAGVILCEVAVLGRSAIEGMGLRRYIACGALAATTLVMVKLPMAVMAGSGVCLVAWHVWQWKRDWRYPVTALVTAGLVALALVPLVIVSWLQTGSPGGVTTAALFGSPVFWDGETLAAYNATLQSAVSSGRFLWVYEMAYNNLYMILGTLVFPLVALPAWRWPGTIMLAVQSITIVAVLPLELRYLSGLQWLLPALAVAAIWIRLTASPRYQQIAHKVGVHKGAIFATSAWLAATVPWIALTAYVAAIFVPVSLGLEPANRFVNRYTSFAADFAVLDKRLPRDAVLYFSQVRRGTPDEIGWYSRVPVWYAPRPSVMNHSEVEDISKTYLVVISDPAGQNLSLTDQSVWLPEGARLGLKLLDDRKACFYPSRTLAGGCTPGHMRVYALAEASD